MSERRRASDDDLYPTYFGIGQAHHVSEGDRKPGRAVGRLLVPGPEQRRGWRESYVYRDEEPPPSGRPIGFRR